MPTSLLGILIFLVAIAPGFIFERFRDRRHARAKESSFREISRTLVASVLLGVPSSAVMLWIWSFAKSPSPAGIAQLLSADPGFISTHYLQLALTCLVYLLSSTVLAYLWILATHLKVLKPANISAGLRWWQREGRIGRWAIGPLDTSASIWTKVLEAKVPSDNVPYLTVIMKSGDTWSGRPAHFTESLDENRDLALAPELLYLPKDGEPIVWTGSYVVIRSDNIDAISVAYLPVSRLPGAEAEMPSQPEATIIS